MMKHDFLESVPLYALDALSGQEKSRMQEHLRQGCEICEPELRLFQETAARLPSALPNSSLPVELKETIWNRIEVEAPRESQPFNWRIMTAAAVIAIALTGGWWILRMNGQLKHSKQELAKFRQQWMEQKNEIEWLRDPSVQLALLTGLEPAPQAKGKMVWNPQLSRGMFYGNSLPPVSAEKSYQLWVIGARGPVSAGVFSPDSNGAAVVTISRIEGTAEGTLQFAVTIEPRGGVPQPTGSMVLAGKPL
jgi:Anti-sigma-K factor rskA, C-terminal